MRIPHLIGILAVVGLAGAVHGYWTHRWDGFAAGEFDRELFAKVPARINGWEASEAEPQEETGYRPYSMSRRFLNRVHDRTAVASLISGITGKVATHTPDVCYPGSGYQLKTEITREEIPLPDGVTATFFVAEFEKTTATSKDRIRVRWSWCAGGAWEARDKARLAYIDEPVLHKLYVVHPVTPGAEHPSYKELVAGLAAELSKKIAGE